MGDDFSIEDAIIILKRRLVFFLIPALILAPLGILTVMLMPAKYTAKGTILVESQQIPQEFVRSTINAYAQERIETIQQRVMTRNRLLQVADDYNLFPDSRRLSETDRVALMRDQFDIDLITATRNRGSSRDGTIAFTVSFTDREAEKAFLVANRFMTLFLDEDVRTRTAGASNTTDFFQREAVRLRNAVSDIEGEISSYKSENANALPEHLDMHLERLERLRSEESTLTATIAQLEEETNFLQNQRLAGNSARSGASEQLAILEGELARLRATYRDNYPEVIAKRDEIASVKRQLAPNRDIERLRTAMLDAEDSLKAIEATATPGSSELSAAEEKLERAQEALSNKITQASRNGPADLAGIQLDGRIAVNKNRARSIAKRIEVVQDRIIDLESRIANTPNVERGLSALTRDHENIFSEYQDILAKQQDAQLAQNLEENQQAEKISILEPALKTEAPSSPNRPRLGILAVFVALGVGTSCAFATEFVIASIRGRNHLTSLLGGAPIAVIPYIENEDDRRFKLFKVTGRKGRSDNLHELPA